MTCNLFIIEGSVMVLVVVVNPPLSEAAQTGDSVRGGYY